MVKISKKPAGFLSGKEAAQRLGMKLSTFYTHVKQGNFKKIILPGSKEGYFSREEIEKIAQARELILLLYSVEPVTFSRATSEDDIRGIVDLCVAIYGIGGTPSLETRLEIWNKNPYVYYVVKQENIVVGYISMIWFDNEALNVVMGATPKTTRATSAGNGVYSVTGPEHVLPFIPGTPIDSLFISMGVRPGLSNQQQREYGFKLLRDTLDVLANFTQDGMPVKRLLATSEKADGIQLARKLGMKETRYPNDPLLRYELDLETSSSPLTAQYRRILAQSSDKHTA